MKNIRRKAFSAVQNKTKTQNWKEIKKTWVVKLERTMRYSTQTTTQKLGLGKICWRERCLEMVDFLVTTRLS